MREQPCDQARIPKPLSDLFLSFCSVCNANPIVNCKIFCIFLNSGFENFPERQISLPQQLTPQFLKFRLSTSVIDLCEHFSFALTGLSESGKISISASLSQVQPVDYTATLSISHPVAAQARSMRKLIGRAVPATGSACRLHVLRIKALLSLGLSTWSTGNYEGPLERQTHLRALQGGSPQATQLRHLRRKPPPQAASRIGI